MSLDEDDRRWIREELGRIKADFKSELGSIKAEFRSELEQVEHRFRVGLEHMETTLLTEFHKWASPVEMRQRSHSAVLRALDTEVEAISEQR